MVEWNRFRLAVAGVALFCARDAAAQDQGSAPRPSSSAGDLAEQRMRAGDCPGALDAFDQALRVAILPELQRDRGSCHEKLGHPFPAIDDYRAYLTARPNAADADAIRARLVALEEQAGIVKPNDKGSKSGAELSISVGADTGGGSSGAKGMRGGAEAAEHSEQLELQADSSPLRRGHGLVLGVLFDGRRYGDSAFGWAELAGIDLRYSFGPIHTVLLELEIENINAGGTSTSLRGPGALAGYEARIGLNPRLDDALLVGAALGYQSLSQGASGAVFSFVEPQGRFGYRHVFGPSLGLEAMLEGGVAFAHLTGNAGSANSTMGLFGGHVGVVIGF